MNFNRFQQIYCGLLLAFAGVLSVSGTIALRNVLHLILLVMALGYLGYAWRDGKVVVSRLVADVPMPLWLWCAYLVLFPLIAPDGAGALFNLIGKGMWGESVLTWLLVFGAFLILGPQRLTLWLLALISAVPVFIHLVLMVLAWAGVLQPAFYADPSLQEMVLSCWAVISDSSLLQSPFHSFPMGFRGIEPMHGNLGYPASQTMCLSLAVMFAAWSQNNRGMAIKAWALIVLCFVSVVIAQSRAATYFGLMILAAACLIYMILVRKGRHFQSSLGVSLRYGWWTGLLMLGVGGLCLVFFLKVVSANQVWYSMWDKMFIGFQVDSPKALLCDGFTPSTLDFVRQKHPDKDGAYIDYLTDGLRGDGGRVLLARVGAELSVQYPWGWNGGRDAYQHRIAQLCGHVPAMDFSHAHNAWINLTLALGWAGAILYLWVFLFFAQSGWRALQQEHQWPQAMALLLFSVFWLLRGMVDAVYQEHYLQMQAFFLLTVYLLVRSGKPVSV